MQELFQKGVTFQVRKGWRLGRMIDALHDSDPHEPEILGLLWRQKSIWRTMWRKFEEEEWFPGILEFIKKSETPEGRTTP